MPLNVIVTIDKDHLDDLKNVALKLEKEGLSISDVKDYGLIFGQLDSSKISKIKNHKEVANVESDNYIQLPPPDSEIQ